MLRGEPSFVRISNSRLQLLSGNALILRNGGIYNFAHDKTRILIVGKIIDYDIAKTCKKINKKERNF